ncbi:TonB-dependent receptor plug domain-containing protein [Cognatiluteimonas telluris]|jgi:iron complex outermembrane receptor protein|uniref:TonB-dependent receptor plug domain-containing protein n=1 Tax=Cognatiluteimonas telluris TaxID=1104775 RepID=UPI00140B6516|nr:TonB-dependent receptor [Lysobacter telluris]
MTDRKMLPQAIRLALLAGSVSLVAGNAFAQDAQSTDTTTTDTTQDTKSTTLDRIEVTGSRIKRAEVEGALPVTVITRKDIEVSGKTTVADLLQNSTFNSFGSNKPTSGSSAQSMSELSLRGLGGGRSLILIDGRRAPLSPQFSEAGADLNSIPLAAVERVEILSDGASAIYGADAIGGVVNIITRKDFNGVEATVGMGSGNWGGDTEEGSLLMGASSDKGRLLGGVSYNNRDISYVKDKPWMEGFRGPSSFANNYTTPAVNPVTGDVSYGGQIGPVPGGCTNPGFYLDGNNFCRYDYNVFAADTAQLKQKGLFLKGDYQINDDWSVYMNTSVTQVASFGRFAPALADHGIFIPADSPNNHTGEINGTGVNTDTVLKHRFAALGPRDNFDTTTTVDANIGFNWQVNDSTSLDFGVRRAHSGYTNFGYNYVNVPIATQLIQDGTYDIVDPINNDPDVLDAIRATTTRDSHFNEDELYALASIDVFDLAGGTSGLAVGVEHHKQNFADIYDAQSSAGNIGGSSGNSSAGSRNFNSMYAEWLLPFTNWFEADVAYRYDNYSDFGTSSVPKISVRFHPMDNLTLRASYGEGFRAPPLTILNSEPAFSADTVIDGPTAIAFGLDPTKGVQIDGLRVATPDLQAEKSKQWSAGVVYDPTDWLSMKLDYYNIKLTNQVKFFSSQEVVNRTRLGQFLPSNLFVIRDPSNGAIVQVRAGYANEGFINTDGFDFNAATKFDLGSFGTLKNNLQASYIRKFEVSGSPGTAPSDQIGTTDAPKWRATLTNQWEKGDFSLVWTINAMQQTPSYTTELLADYGYANACQAGVDYGYSNSLSCKSYYMTHDVSATMKMPWNGKITIGAINVTNKEPRLDQFAFTPPYYNQGLYWGYGRQIYFRYSQTW